MASAPQTYNMGKRELRELHSNLHSVPNQPLASANSLLKNLIV